ncbi:DUF6177 family protein [Streptomyces sp. NPDC024017]|uniref:DUF6177 family protein n=1 Tax=Streptomyces sp. NPDC024017 TaxID=3154326 RepID=UPI0033EFD143
MLRTPSGVEEDVTLAFGYGRDEAPPLDVIEELATALDTDRRLVTLLTTIRAARHDLTVPPSLEAPPFPVAFTLGSDEAEAIGRAHAGHPPLSLMPTRLGLGRKPALHYLMGDGTDPDAWSTFQRLIRHLFIPRQTQGK